jgi:dethiobiotin synthetase
MNSSIFISGIHTDIGKTIVSSILCHALDAAYWKPVQAGSLECTDSDVVRKYNPDINIFPSRYNLKMACSPHFAAQHEQLNIRLEDFKLPISDKVLIIEGAGGLFSPIGSACTNLDFIEYYKLPFILVVKHYLGSISHTIACLEAIRNKAIDLLGIIYVGEDASKSEDFIHEKYNVQKLGRVAVVDNLDMEYIAKQAIQFKKNNDALV